jgi:hypothetical protein
MRRENRRPKVDTPGDPARVKADPVSASKVNLANTMIQGAILCAMMYGAFSVERLTARHFQWQWSAAYVERLNSEHLVRARATFDNWVRTGETLESLIARSIDRSHGKADPEKTAEERIESERAATAARIEQDLRVIVNFLQELAVAMKHGTLDELYTYDCFGVKIRTTRLHRWGAHASPDQRLGWPRALGIGFRGS